jgi:hypothetical protein
VICQWTRTARNDLLDQENLPSPPPRQEQAAQACSGGQSSSSPPALGRGWLDLGQGHEQAAR